MHTLKIFAVGPLTALAAFCVLTFPTQAQPPGPDILGRNLIVPQSGVYHGSRVGVQMEKISADIRVVEQVATTRLTIKLLNKTKLRQEAEILLPVPNGVSVRDFSFEGPASEPTARLLPKEEAERIYREIVSRMKDPALLEFAGMNLLKSSVFPVEANGRQTVQLVYEQILRADGPRVDYVLPRSEALSYMVPWEYKFTVSSKTPLTTLYSPSHPLKKIVRTRSAKKQSVLTTSVTDAGQLEPGALRVSYLRQEGELTASLMAYPNAKKDGGYFLLLAGLPEQTEAQKRQSLKREITLVIDRSGSMRGEKFAQAREAALQIIGALQSGESFNVIAYNNEIEPFSEEPVEFEPASLKQAEQFLGSLAPVGGTNIYDALQMALGQEKTDRLPIVLFLTDGLPTAGQTSETAIRDLVTEENPHSRRVFTFGVGADVNTPLLEALAADSRAKATFVLPGQNVEVAVGEVFRQLQGPVLAEPVLTVRSDKKNKKDRVNEMLPGKLNDFFAGDQLVLLGKYKGNAPLTFNLRGNYLGKTRKFKFTFKLDNASTRNSFVPRLWASRKIGTLVDAIRRLGANGSSLTSLKASPDSEVRELADQILQLTSEFGILTEYTAFLAQEGSEIANNEDNLKTAVTNFRYRALETRTGLASLNQSLNTINQKDLLCTNGRNCYFGSNLQQIEIATVQQISDRSYFRRKNRWVDGRILTKEQPEKIDEEVDFGSDRYNELLEEFVRDGRQACLSLRGDILMQIDGKRVLIHGLQPPVSEQSPEAEQSDSPAQQQSLNSPLRINSLVIPGDLQINGGSTTQTAPQRR